MARAYHTGLVTSDLPGSFPAPPWTGKGWRAVLRALPGSRPQLATHWGTASGKPRVVKGKEVIILAGSLSSAQRALDGVWAAHQLLQGPPLAEPPLAFPADARRPEGFSEDQLRGLRRRHLSTSNIPLACFAAAKASRRRDLTYALALFELSQSIHANYLVDLDPSESPNLPLSAFPADHVRFAYAIVTAYAVLEQLGLEVRASRDVPSRIGGAWNPTVKADLEGRLRARGVDLSESALLDVRGPVRRIERLRPVSARGKAPWARGPVRDVEVDLVDAIAHVSWLRSKVAAHKMGELVPALSIYDVANAQYLARRLLRDSLGLRR